MKYLQLIIIGFVGYMATRAFIAFASLLAMLPANERLIVMLGVVIVVEVYFDAFLLYRYMTREDGKE